MGRAVSGLFQNLKDFLGLAFGAQCRVENFERVQFFQLFTLDEAALMSEPLVSQVLTTPISDFLVAVSVRLFVPIINDFLVSLFNFGRAYSAILIRVVWVAHRIRVAHLEIAQTAGVPRS